MAKFEKAYGEGGVKGIRALVELLEGPEGLDKFVQEYSAEKDRWESMDPDERTNVIRQQEIESERSKVSKLEQEYKAKLDELTARQEQAEVKTLESKLHPAFDRYRFAGKLGDPVAEHRYDTAIWNQAMEALEQYPDNVELTPAMIEKEFRNVAQAFGKVINKQVDSKVQKVIRKTKEDATRKAQATVSKTMQTSSAAEQFQRDVRSSGSGNIANALRSLMSGQVKLK